MRQAFALCFTLGMVLLLGACVPPPPPTPTPAPDLCLYLLVEVEGDLSHKRPGWKEYLPLSFGTCLNRKDLLRAAPDAHGLIVCPDLALVEMAGDDWGGLPHLEATRVLTRGESIVLPPPAAPVLFRGESLVVGPQRVTPLAFSIPYILSPRHTFIQTDRPLLRWHPFGTGVVTYTVRVWGGALDWRARIAATELRYPEEAPPLEPGVPYHLTVTDADGRSSDEERTALDLSFILLSPEEIATIQKLVARVQELDLNERATHLLKVEIYAAHGLQADAIALLEELAPVEDAPTVHRRMGDLYLEIGLYTEAQKSYEQALAGYRTLGQKDGEAHVLAGLGLGYRGDRDDATARDYLELARDLYRVLGDADGVTRVENVLDEMGGR